jgi:hypothetical protein
MALFAVQVHRRADPGLDLCRCRISCRRCILPFNIVRMLHTNALIVWLLLGFFGAAYFLIPEEAEREIHSPSLAYLQLRSWSSARSGVVVTYVFNLFDGNFLLGKEGREFLEQPMWVKIGIVVAALIFLYNVTMTVLKGRKTAITNILLIGLWGIWRCFFLFAFYNPSNLSARQDVLVVRRPPLGRGRVGTGHGLDPRLPDAEADGRRPRGRREVALCHRRHGAVLRHPRHRATTTTGSARRATGSGSARSSRRSRSFRSSP